MRRGLLLLATACSFRAGTLAAPDAIGDDGNDIPWLPGYAYRKQVTITPPALTAPLVDYPLGIIEATIDPDLAAHAAPDGGDVAVTASDMTTVLASELEAFDSGGFALWAKLPALSAPTTVYLYYGGPVATRSSPWSSDLRAIWHMSDPATENVRDSLAQTDLVQPTATKLPGSVAGRAGSAREFDGVDDEVDAASATSLDMGIGSFSYSMWVFVDTSHGGYDMPLYKGGASAGDPGFDVELGTGNWSAYVGDGTSPHGLYFADESTMLHAWHHLAGVVDRTNAAFTSYVDGVKVQSVAITGILSLTSTQVFAVSYSGHLFHGQLDEFRVFGVVQTADWIATEYANLATPGFLQLGAEETVN